MTTIPTKIVDKNGKQTTVHKKIAENAANARVLSPNTKKASEMLDLTKLAVGDHATVMLDDGIFGTAGIHRTESGALVSHASLPIDGPAMDALKESVGDLSAYLSENKGYIESVLTTRYGASSIEVFPDEGLVNAVYSVPLSGDVVNVEELRAAYNTDKVNLLAIDAYSTYSLSNTLTDYSHIASI